MKDNEKDPRQNPKGKYPKTRESAVGGDSPDERQGRNTGPGNTRNRIGQETMEHKTGWGKGYKGRQETREHRIGQKIREEHRNRQNRSKP
jgi:hypothetical protein